MLRLWFGPYLRLRLDMAALRKLHGFGCDLPAIVKPMANSSTTRWHWRSRLVDEALPGQSGRSTLHWKQASALS